MIYGLIVCALGAAAAFGAVTLLCRYLLDRLGRRELGVKTPPVPGAKAAGEKYIPKTGGLFLAAGTIAVAALCLIVYAIIAGANSMTSMPRLSGLAKTYLWGGLFFSALCCAAGFLNDYAIVFKNAGRLPATRQAVITGAVAAAFLASAWLGGDGGRGLTFIPFVGEVELGAWYYVLSLPLIMAVVSGARLASEADGLSPTTGFFSLMPVVAAAVFCGSYDSGIVGVAGAGGCLGFLMWNFCPARAHTGSAGGAFTGAILCAAAFSARMPYLLLFAGAAYIAEAITALLGAAVPAVTKKETRFAPMHRMIGRSGRDDVGLTVIFSAITAILGALGAAFAIFGQ